MKSYLKLAFLNFVISGANPSQNGSPRSATSPAQSVLTMPNDPPSNSTTCDQGGVSEIASIQNGKICLIYLHYDEYFI